MENRSGTVVDYRGNDQTAYPLPGGGTIEGENPMWVGFARSMMPLQLPAAEGLAGLLHADAGQKSKVLDIAAGHGAFAWDRGAH